MDKVFKNNGFAKGFTLVELAIVIVIIGLLIGGVLGARSLIEAAERNSFIKDLVNVRQSVLAFDLEYDALPGDFNEATEYWPGQTDDGNGDKKITTNNESVDFWQHLALAEIWPADFTGIPGAGTANDPLYKPGINVPKISMGDNVVSRVWHHAQFVMFNVPRTGNFLSVGGPTPNGDVRYGFLSGKDAKHIDEKIDDGIGALGKLVFMRGDGYDSPECSTGGASNNTFTLTSDNRSCRLVYYFQK